MSGPQVADAPDGGMCDPVCQVFINDHGKRSRYTLTNFASLYSPSNARSCRYLLTIIDCSGIEAAKGEIEIEPFGTVELVPSNFFEGTLPDLGLFTTELVDWEGKPAHKDLGILRPYFYAMYHDATMSSFAIVHPQTTLLKEAPASLSWRSAHIVKTAEVGALEFFQVNPMSDARDTSIAVCDLCGTAKVSSSARMPGRSVRRVFWQVEEFASNDYVSVSVSAMTAPNAKPLMFQHTSNGFTAAHS